jgi:ribosomal protein S18 acetylase RimI-like enzyme
MIDPTVRRATAADVEALQALEHEARAGLVDVRGGRRWLEEHPEIGAGWLVGERTVLVAELADPVDPAGPGHVVGFLVLDVAGRIAHVDQVYVTPRARELGFGDALLAAATGAALEQGAEVLEGHALPGDRETKNLYERAGITARLITVSRPLR